MGSAKEGVVGWLATDPRTAGMVASTTAAAGVGDWFHLIPDDIGKLAAVLGVVLSAVLIVTHLRRGRLDARKLDLEIAALEAAATAREAARRSVG